ncbi:hypothetical protein WAI453_013404 [Rhynchosporium graminicola]
MCLDGARAQKSSFTTKSESQTNYSAKPPASFNNQTLSPSRPTPETIFLATCLPSSANPPSCTGSERMARQHRTKAPKPKVPTRLANKGIVA